MRKNFLYMLLLGIILLSGSGCAALLLGVGGGAGAGTVAYIRGELKSTEESSIDEVWLAALKAMEDLEFTVTSKLKDAVSGKLVAHDSKDTKIEINLEKVSDKLTEVKIRVGVFGDESLSRLILERLKKHL